MAIVGYEMGKNLIRILGLPKETRAFTLECKAPDEAVTIKCEYFPELPDGGRALFTELREYQLIEKPDTEDIKSPFLGTHHGKKPIKVNVKDAMKRINLDVSVVGFKEAAMRIKIATFMVRLAAKIMGCGVKIESR